MNAEHGEQTFDFRHHRKPTLTPTAIMADEYDAVEAAEIKKKRAFRKFSYRGIDLDLLPPSQARKTRYWCHPLFPFHSSQVNTCCTLGFLRMGWAHGYGIFVCSSQQMNCYRYQ